MASISDAQALAVREGWISDPVVTGLYVSAGGDTQPLPLLHPGFLADQGAMAINAPNLIVYVDAERPGDGEDRKLRFEDERTQIETPQYQEVEVRGGRGDLLRVSLVSNQLTDREIAILRLRMTNDQFADLALAEGWVPEWFIAVCDGCGAFGGNHRCENSLIDPETSIPTRLGARYWVTDHLPGGDAETTRAGGKDDLTDGQFVSARDPRIEVRLRQVCFLSTGWRSRVADTVRLYGGARVFEVEQPLRHTCSDASGADLRAI